MKGIEFRTLRANEIEVRPQQIKNGKANMLLYIDSRAVVNLLNETVGNMNWQMEFYEVNRQTVGKLGIYDDERQAWVWKSDVGSESNVEAQKGLISDTYKRCLARWGVMELYSAPKITVEDDGYKCTGYKVLEIDYDGNRNIKHLVIGNKFGKEVFRWDNDKPTQTQTIAYTLRVKPVEEPKAYDVNEEPPVSVDNSIAAQIKAYCGKKKLEQGVDLKELRAFFEFYNKRADNWKYKKFNGDSLWDSWMARVAS